MQLVQPIVVAFTREKFTSPCGLAEYSCAIIHRLNSFARIFDRLPLATRAIFRPSSVCVILCFHATASFPFGGCGCPSSPNLIITIAHCGLINPVKVANPLQIPAQQAWKSSISSDIQQPQKLPSQSSSSRQQCGECCSVLAVVLFC